MTDVEPATSTPEPDFAWIGATEPDSVFYYRIDSPVILIEFDHEGPPTSATWPRIERAQPRAHR